MDQALGQSLGRQKTPSLCDRTEECLGGGLKGTTDLRPSTDQSAEH